MSMRRLSLPRPATVRADERGMPVWVGRTAVEAITEDWVVEDRWWTGRPLRRRYFEAVLGNGACAVVYHDLESGRWYAQR